MADKLPRVSIALHASQIIYSMSFEMLQVALPSVVEGLVGQDSGSMYSRVMAYFALVQLLGGLFLGQLADVVGGKNILVLSQLCSALHYFLLSRSAAPWQLYLAYIPAAFQAGTQAAQTVSSEWNAKEDRVFAIGKLWLSYALGGVMGSLLAGRLGAIESAAVSSSKSILSIGAFLSLAVAVALAVFLPQTPASVVEARKTSKDRWNLNFSGWVTLLKRDSVLSYLMLTLAEGAFSGLLVFTLPQLARDHYSMGTRLLGPLIALQLITAALSQGLLAPHLERSLNVHRTVTLSLGLSGVGALLLAVLPAAPWALYVSIVPFTVGTSVLDVVLTSVGTWIAPVANVGAILSLYGAVGTGLTGMFCPLLAVGLDSSVRWPALAVVTGVLMLWLAAYAHLGIWSHVLARPEPILTETLRP